MPGKIKIENLRNIRKLKFNIPDRGVWLLTAGNGGGKSSLLACLRRIGYRLAFPVHFPSSQRSDRLDSFAGAKVTYKINGEEVAYTYSGVRWVPIPKRNSNLFDQFGYSEVVYIGATADRITPRPGDFDPARVTRAAPAIIQSANRIFETDRFDLLRRINLTRGTWNRAFVMAHDDNPRTYHSEGHFSMGELCVLNLVQTISDARNNSMLIIDELELAIHPRAQRKLLEYLEEESNRKNLTIIFSTHSVTLLKSTNRNRIIFLNPVGNGNVDVIYDCFPTYALGYIAANEERIADCLIYVEDENAAALVEPLVKLAVANKYTAQDIFPTVTVLPIGPFDSVIRFLRGNRAALPDHVQQHALLDQDVQAETLQNWQNDGNAVRLAEFAQVEHQTNFLPWVPEVIVCEEMNRAAAHYQQQLRAEYTTNRIGIRAQDFAFVGQFVGADLRRRAKQAFRELISQVSQSTGKTSEEIRKHVFKEVAEKLYADDPGGLMALLGRMV